MDPTRWAPANETERRMREAWEAGDATGFADLLMRCRLYLPGFPTDGMDRQRLLTRRRDDRTYLLVFTSIEALDEAVGPITHDWRMTNLAELIASWPDPAWGLAVSPQTPIGAYLGPEQIQAMADDLPAEPAFEPADEKERAMYAAQLDGDPAVYLDLLVVSDVLLPVAAPVAAEDLGQPGFAWQITHVDGIPTVGVFTSAQRLRESVGPEVPTVQVSFVRLLRAWPNPGYRLAVNPGTAISSAFTGAQVPDLLHWAQGVALRHAPASSPTAAPSSSPVPSSPVPEQAEPERFEVSIGQADADRYLVDGYDRVSGQVRLAGTGSDLIGYLVRWYGDTAESPPGRPVTELPLPHGTQLIKLVVGEEVVVGTYDAELRRWRPAIADVLRGFTT